jgi:hypothetical protein
VASIDQEQGGRRRPSTFLRRNKKVIVWVTLYAILLEIAFLIAPEPVSAALTFANKILGVFDWAFIGVQTLAENMAASRAPERTALSVHMFMAIWTAAYFIAIRILVDILLGAVDGYIDEPGTAHERPQGLTRHMTPPSFAVVAVLVVSLAVAWGLGMKISDGVVDRSGQRGQTWGLGHSFIGIVSFGVVALSALKLLEMLIVGSFLTLRRKNKTTNDPQNGL